MSTAISCKPVLYLCRWFVCEPAERDMPQYRVAGGTVASCCKSTSRSADSGHATARRNRGNVLPEGTDLHRGLSRRFDRFPEVQQGWQWLSGMARPLAAAGRFAQASEPPTPGNRGRVAYFASWGRYGYFDSEPDCLPSGHRIGAWSLLPYGSARLGDRGRWP